MPVQTAGHGHDKLVELQGYIAVYSLCLPFMYYSCLRLLLNCCILLASLALPLGFAS